MIKTPKNLAKNRLELIREGLILSKKLAGNPSLPASLRTEQLAHYKIYRALLSKEYPGIACLEQGGNHVS